MTQQNNNFNKSYSDLNAAQKKAVDNISGPLLVVAGPGTGKTQLLSTRVAQIIKTTDTDPSQILCLTFTNKAAANMRERLYQLAGAESRFVVIKTFHAFAGEIMQKYPDYFWSGAGLTAAPDAVQLEIIEEILSGLPLSNPLAAKFAGQYTLVSDVKKALKLVKEAGLTPKKLSAIIEFNLAYIDEIEKDVIKALSERLSAKKLPQLVTNINKLPNHNVDSVLTPLKSLREVMVTSLEHAVENDIPTNKTLLTGAWKKRYLQTVEGVQGMHDERKRNNWWLLLADVYENYRKKLHHRGHYDYADMLIEVISQLENHSSLRAEVQEQFLYVLIDEFQDTNAAQLRLAHLVADHHLSEGSPNIMAVGDDDQTIYKFNGAELNNMLGFTKSYPNAKLVVLEQNYRSNKQVLNTAERVISLAKDRLVYRVKGLSKSLTPSSSPPIKSGQQKLIIHPTQEYELSAIADELSKLTPAQRSNTAILARDHESLGRLAYLCQLRNINVRYEQNANILEHEAIQQFTLLAMIINGVQSGDRQNVSAFLQQSLRHPMWKLPPLSLWQLATALYPNGDWLLHMKNSNNKELSKIASWFLNLANEAPNQPLPLCAEYLLGLRQLGNYTSPLKSYFLAQNRGSSYLQTLSAIRLLRSLIHEFSKNQHKSLSDYLNLVNVMQANKQVISDESTYVSGEQAVQFYTIHKAKGLEFDRVYVIDCTQPNWQPKTARRRPPANLPLQPNGDDDDDYVRLMYVAITRARHSVFLHSFAKNSVSEDVVTSPLAMAATPYNINPVEPTSKILPTISLLEEHIAWPRLSANNEKPMLINRLENFSLNVTGLLNFLDVTNGGPQYFLERNLLRLPEAKSSSLAFGSAVHAALETAQELINRGSYSLVKVQKAYEIALQNENLPNADFERQLDHGNNLLKQLLVGYAYKLPVNSLAEVTMKEILEDGVIISGKLDRIDQPSKDRLVVVDYKTGSGLTNLLTKSKSIELKAWKHRSQLIFYSMLLRNSARFSNKKIVTGQMVYVQSDTPKNLVLSYTPTTDEVKQMAMLSSVIYHKVKALDLPDTASYSHDYRGVQQFIADLISEKI